LSRARAFSRDCSSSSPESLSLESSADASIGGTLERLCLSLDGVHSAQPFCLPPLALALVGLTGADFAGCPMMGWHLATLFATSDLFLWLVTDH
jgi:hypothetical protein